MIGEPVATSVSPADSDSDSGGLVQNDGLDAGARSPRHPWTEGDRARLRQLCDQNLPSSEIARMLGRTLRAVDAMSLRMGIHRHDSIRPWSQEECALILRLHADGASWAAIAGAVPGRSAIAVFRKLSHLVGPAPFKAGCQAKPAVFSQPQARLSRPRSPPPEMPVAVPVRVDAMVRWLRSRDFMVLHSDAGWRVDHRTLATTGALLEFVNTRRGWLRLPPFVLLDAEEEVETLPVPASRRFGGGRGPRFGSLSYR